MLRFLKWCCGSTDVSKSEYSMEQCFPRVWGWISRAHSLKENRTVHYFLVHATWTTVQHLKAQVRGSRAVILVINGLPTTKEGRIRLQITGWMVITTRVCRRWFKEPNGSLFIPHQKILVGVRLSETTDLSSDLSSIPTSTSCGSAHHLQPPRKRCCCSSRGNTLEGSFYICHWAKLYMYPKGKWVTQTYAHRVWFLSPPLLGFYKAMEQQRGEKGRRRAFSDALSDTSNHYN